MTVFLAFTTGLFGGIIFGLYAKPLIKGFSNILKEDEEKPSDIDLLEE